MKEIYLEGRKMIERTAAHDEIKEKLLLPEYYGGNLDALWDCLTEFSEDTVITVCHPGAMLSALREYGCRLLLTFFEAEKENAALHIVIGSHTPYQKEASE